MILRVWRGCLLELCGPSAYTTIAHKCDHDIPGFRLTTPSSANDPRPNITAPSSVVETGHGAASSCVSMTSSMLASPQGASEEYMKIFSPSLSVNGCTLGLHVDEVVSDSSRRRKIADSASDDEARR